MENGGDGRLTVTRIGSTFVITPRGFSWRIDPSGEVFRPVDDSEAGEEQVAREEAVRLDPSLASYLA